ncbi:MAG: hypothetical protein HQL99_02420 [Magnetococcales bacterium]|nr:hypothetical protein [Magnetococcales bacterium]
MISLVYMGRLWLGCILIHAAVQNQQKNIRKKILFGNIFSIIAILSFFKVRLCQRLAASGHGM